MEEGIAFGFLALLFIPMAFIGMMLAVPLAIMWEEDRHMFDDLPWYGVLLLAVLYPLLVIYRELHNA